MNRILKKAVSFIAALAVGVSTLAAGAVSASAAAGSAGSSASVKTSVLKNQYDMYISFEDGALYAANATKKTKNEYGDSVSKVNISSKTSYVMVNSSGSRVSVKNTIGFTKIYYTNTEFGGVTLAEDPQNNCLGNCIVVGKGNKYAVLLSNGKFMNNGKYYDKVNTMNGYITAVSGNTTYVYSSAGKLLGKIASNKLGNCVGYDSASKTFLFTLYTPSEDGWGGTYKHRIINGGKTVKTFDNYLGYFKFVVSGKKTYVQADFDYYTVKGKSTTYERPVYEEKEEEHNLSVNYTYSEDNKTKTVTVTDSNGKKILSYEAPVLVYSIFYDKSDTYELYDLASYVFRDGQLILATGGFYVIDDATGKILVKNTRENFLGISSVSDDNSTFVLKIGEKSENGYGEYYTYSEKLYSSKAKGLSNSYDEISTFKPTGSFGDGITTYSSGASFIVCNEEGNYGIISNKGKVLVKVENDYPIAVNSAVTVFEDPNKYKQYCMFNNYTGKKLHTFFRNINYNSYHMEDRRTMQRLSSNAAYIVTTNEEGTKFGCIIVKW